jgi:hypothetical protein
MIKNPLIRRFHLLLNVIKSVYKLTMNTLESNLKQFLRGKKACSPGDYLKLPHWPNGRMIPGKGKMLGQGLYGKVYRGSVNNNGRRYVAYKEIDTRRNNLGMANFEFNVAKKLKGYGVPDMYLYKKCEGIDILYLEYIKGGELEKWWKTTPSLEAKKSAMVQILYNLYRIRQKFPGFRHHDLHGGNILIRPVPVKNITIRLPTKTYTISNGGVEAVMIDFGLSTFPRMSNPMIDDGSYEHVGISKKSHPLYDLHLFMNTVFKFVEQPKNKEDRQVHNFIKSLIPDGYRGMENTYVTFYRLGKDFNEQHNKVLPSFQKVLSSSFFTGETRVERVLPKPIKRAVILKPKPKPKSPVNQKNAMARAIAVMKGKTVQTRKRPGVPVIAAKPKSPVVLPRVYKFTNRTGKDRVYKSKAWYEKALAKNKSTQ